MSVPSATSRTNEAAERLRDVLVDAFWTEVHDYGMEQGSGGLPSSREAYRIAAIEARSELEAGIDAALSEERCRTVERTGIRITSQQIRDALKVLGHTGTAAEAFVRSAAGAMADILDDVEFGR